MKFTVSLTVAVLSVVLSGLLPGESIGQSYPNKLVRLLVPYAAGGTQDMVSRVIAPKLSEGLGQQVVVDNRPGGGTVIAAEMVARSAPDGYTIISTNIAHAANPFLLEKLPYDTSKDFASVILLGVFPMVLVTHPSLPVKSIGDLIAFVKARPGQLNYASSGTGGAGHLAMELLLNSTGMDMTRITYKGGGQALSAVLGGEVPMTFIPVPLALANAKAGKVRVIVVSSAERMSMLSDAPTVAESGVPGYDFYEWQAVFARGGTPRDIVMRLNTEINKVLAIPEITKRISDGGGEIVGGTPERLTAHVHAELARWSAVFKQSGMSGPK